MSRPSHYRKRVAEPPGEDALGEVLTVAEAAAQWDRHPDTIRLHIASGNLCARRTDCIYLVARASLVAYYGEPVSQCGTDNLEGST